MIVSLSIESFSGAREIVEQLVVLDKEMQSFFMDRTYGDYIQNIFVGIIIVPESARKFHPVRSFRHRKAVKFVREGRAENFTNVVSFDIALDYERLVSMEISVAKNLIGMEILDKANLYFGSPLARPRFNGALFVSDLREVIGRW